MQSQTTLSIRRALRAQAKAPHKSTPVEVIPGNAAPKVKGESYYFTTPGGKPIFYPAAYRWPKVYHGSTIRVEVGSAYVAALAAAEYAYASR